MRIDDKQLSELVVESQDLHSDAMRGMPEATAELADLHRSGELKHATGEQIKQFNDGRRAFVQKLGLGALAARGLMASGFAGALTTTIARPVSADTNLDIQILQTASSLEILAIATYSAALGLPFIDQGNSVIKLFAQTTRQQHDDHRAAFQAQTKALGGTIQTSPNAKYAAVVEAAKSSLLEPGDVVNLAAALEEVATETYLADLSLLADTRSKTIFARVMGVECQHLATLRAVSALIQAKVPELIAIPTRVDQLPAGAGMASVPMPTQGVDNASPPSEGAVAR
jgi:hypothetical protein